MISALQLLEFSLAEDAVAAEIQKRVALLRLAGLKAGSIFLLRAPLKRETIYWIYSCWESGVICAPIPPSAPYEELISLATSIQANAWLPDPCSATIHFLSTEKSQLSTIDSREKIKAIVFTSGSTGKPKPIAITENNFRANAFIHAHLHRNPRLLPWLCTLPLFHVGGLTILARAHINGAPLALAEGFSPEVAAQWMESGRICGLSLVPTMLSRIVQSGWNAPHPNLETILLGGAPLPNVVAEKLDQLPVAMSYGLTESCGQITAQYGDLSSVGKPQFTEVRLASDGEICLRGPSLSPFLPLNSHGFYSTGDLGSFDVGGRLQVLGRKSDLIISGGENIFPQEVEQALLQHPAVADACLFGVADADWGERLVGVFQPKDFQPAPSEIELIQFLKTKLSAHKIPKHLLPVSLMPRTPSGKLQRHLARGLFPPTMDR